MSEPLTPSFSSPLSSFSFSPSSPISHSGRFSLTLERAKNLRSTTLISRQDPFCRCSLLSQTFQTPTHKSGGSEAIFNDFTMSFDLDGSSPMSSLSLNVEMWSSNMLGDELIGRASIPLSTLLSGASHAWYPLDCPAAAPASPSRHAGDLLISKVTWYPKRVPAPPSPLMLSSSLSDSPVFSFGSPSSLPSVSELSLPSAASSSAGAPSPLRRALSYGPAHTSSLLRMNSLPNLEGNNSSYCRVGAIPLFASH